MLVSVIVPIYNVEHYLDRCIESIISQTYKNLEIILINDGSTDSSLSIINKWKEKDRRIRVIDKKNGGLSDARNKGIEAATGDYFTFVDSDDCINYNMIEHLLNIALENKCLISGCGYISFSNDGVLKYENEADKTKLEKLDFEKYFCKYVSEERVKMVTTWGKLYAKELFQEIRFPIGKLHEDEFTTYKLIDKANKVIFSSAEYYFYFQRENSIMGQKNIKKNFDCLLAFDERDRYIKHFHKELYDFWGESVKYEMFSNCLECLMQNYNTKQTKEIFKSYYKNHKFIKKNIKTLMLLYLPDITAFLVKIKRNVKK